MLAYIRIRVSYHIVLAKQKANKTIRTPIQRRLFTNYIDCKLGERCRLDFTDTFCFYVRCRKKKLFTNNKNMKPMHFVKENKFKVH
jgi:hypothetical protein